MAVNGATSPGSQSGLETPPPSAAPSPQAPGAGYGGLETWSPPGPYAYDAYAGTGLGPVDTWANKPLPGAETIPASAFHDDAAAAAGRAAGEAAAAAAANAGHESPIDKHVVDGFDIHKDGPSSASTITQGSASTVVSANLNETNKKDLIKFAKYIDANPWLMPKDPDKAKLWSELRYAVDDAARSRDWSQVDRIVGEDPKLGDQIADAMIKWEAYWQGTGHQVASKNDQADPNCVAAPAHSARRSVGSNLPRSADQLAEIGKLRQEISLAKAAISAAQGEVDKANAEAVKWPSDSPQGEAAFAAAHDAQVDVNKAQAQLDHVKAELHKMLPGLQAKVTETLKAVNAARAGTDIDKIEEANVAWTKARAAFEAAGLGANGYD